MLNVEVFDTVDQKINSLVGILKERTGPAIVYVTLCLRPTIPWYATVSFIAKAIQLNPIGNRRASTFPGNVEAGRDKCHINTSFTQLSATTSSTV